MAFAPDYMADRNGVNAPVELEWLVWLRRVEAYEPIHYWRFHPARDAALANAIGFASRSNVHV